MNARSKDRMHEILRALTGHWCAICACWPYQAAEARS